MTSEPIKKIPTAKKSELLLQRIQQGDIFNNISVIENVILDRSKLFKDEIFFPYIICLNQECDLENDFNSIERNKDSSLLHLTIAPAFIFEHFLAGKHWGDIFINGETGKRKNTKIKLIMQNQIPRFHYLNFCDDSMPELIIDYKHYFTINRDYLYSKIDNRVCTLENLYKEKISQRFSYYISRIGLPGNQATN